VAMDRPADIEAARDAAARVMRAHLERDAGGPAGIVVLSRSEGDVVAMLLEQLAADEGMTELGKMAGGMADLIRRQAGF
jgi:hypothetical protein